MSLAPLRQTLAVFRKELKDSSRDRRALFAILFGVLVGPAVIAFMVDRITEREASAADVVIPVTGATHAPALVAWLSSQAGVEMVPGPDDPEQAVREGTLDVVLVVSKDYGRRFGESRSAEVWVVADSSRDSARARVRRVRELIQHYGAEIATLRLITRGVSPEAASPLRVREVDVSTPQQRAIPILNFLALFMLLSALTGGMQVATDSTAGERERGSLEPLLVNPAPRWALVAGKWLAASTASFIAVVLTVGFSITLLERVLAPDVGVRVDIGAVQVSTIVLASLSLAPLCAALQTAVGTYSRSFKEAQTYIGVLMTLPVTAIGIIGALYPMTGQGWMYSVPLLSHYLLVIHVLSGQSPDLQAMLTTTTVSLAVIAVLLILTARMFRSERIVFGR